jgi:hypothetical protein
MLVLMTKLLSLSCLVFCVSASGACATAEADPAPVFLDAPVQESAPEPPPEVFGNKVMDSELLSAVELAAERWRAAACVDVRVDGTGVEWSLADSIVMEDGKQANGVLGPNRVEPTYAQVKRTVSTSYEQVATHEMGHRLGIPHVEGLELMNERNLVNRKEGLRYNHIGVEALTALCSIRDCGCFNPEPGPEHDPSLIEVRQCQTITSGPQGTTSVWGPCP